MKNTITVGEYRLQRRTFLIRSIYDLSLKASEISEVCKVDFPNVSLSDKISLNSDKQSLSGSAISLRLSGDEFFCSMHVFLKKSRLLTSI